MPSFRGGLGNFRESWWADEPPKEYAESGALTADFCHDELGVIMNWLVGENDET